MNKDRYDKYKKALKAAPDAEAHNVSVTINFNDKALKAIKELKKYAEWDKNSLINNLFIRAYKSDARSFSTFMEQYGNEVFDKKVSFDLTLKNSKRLKDKKMLEKRFLVENKNNDIESMLILYGLHLYQDFFGMELKNE